MKMAEKPVTELLREAAAALEEQQDAGYERATNMPAPDEVRLGDSSRTQTHRVTLLWSLRKTSRLLATNCTIQSDKGTRFGLRSQVVPLPWMILRTSRPLATNRTTQSD
ncbi:unnamed protein product [Gadus morhua 'NCC']